MTQTERKNKKSRRQDILEHLARMLEDNPGSRITTANLARQVGVTEAALYRHFPSKGKMFEGLIEFIEESVFSRVSNIKQESLPALDTIRTMLQLVLGFAEVNPGLCRIMMGDALAGEHERLRHRVSQFFDRIEAEIKQTVRQAEIGEQKQLGLTAVKSAAMLVAYVEGRIHRYVRSEFKDKPGEGWDETWQYLSQGLLLTPSVV